MRRFVMALAAPIFAMSLAATTPASAAVVRFDYDAGSLDLVQAFRFGGPLGLDIIPVDLPARIDAEDFDSRINFRLDIDDDKLPFGLGGSRLSISKLTTDLLNGSPGDSFEYRLSNGAREFVSTDRRPPAFIRDYTMAADEEISLTFDSSLQVTDWDLSRIYPAAADDGSDLIAFSDVNASGYGTFPVFGNDITFFYMSDNGGSWTTSTVVAPVPLPAGLPMFLVALGVLGLVRRRVG